MPLDFTFSAFDEFCQRATRVPVFALVDFLSRSTLPPTPYVILRVDVDYRETRAVHLARIANRHGLRGSFYFRRRGGQFDLETIQAVATLEHEVGYHFETLDTCRGDFDQAESLFLEYLKQLRSANLEIRTVAAHGSKPTAPTYHANFDLFGHTPALFERAGLLGEATLSLDFRRLAYISDARWRWRRYIGYKPGAKGTPTSLHATIDELARPDAALYLNFHSQQWFANPVSMIYYRARNRTGRWLVPLVRLLAERLP